jgi:hypothetical protein
MLVKDIAENPKETKIFTGTVKEITQFTSNVYRLLLKDVNEDLVYCILLNKWTKKMKSVHRGTKISLGPSKILKIPDEHRSFYAPKRGKNVCEYYFHYEDVGYCIEIHEELSPLCEADILAHRELIVNLIGAIIDVSIENQYGNYFQVLEIIDNTVLVPVRLQVFNGFQNFHIGSVVLVTGAVFKRVSNESIGLIPPESTIKVYNEYNSSDLINTSSYKLLIWLKELNLQIHYEKTLSNSYFSVIYLKVVCTYKDFPGLNQFTMVLYDQYSYYFFVCKDFIEFSWVKIKSGKISGKEIILGQSSCVCGYPDWMSPVSCIIAQDYQRLQIVEKEALREIENYKHLHKVIAHI